MSAYRHRKWLGEKGREIIQLYSCEKYLPKMCSLGKWNMDQTEKAGSSESLRGGNPFLCHQVQNRTKQKGAGDHPTDLIAFTEC